jgi:hypothetical protein
MYCTKCKNWLSDCICDDIDERLASLNNSENFSYRKCAVCNKHYNRCKCENPRWVVTGYETNKSDCVVLKPCPFCGGDGEIRYKTFMGMASVGCGNATSYCSVSPRVTLPEKMAIEAWNNRK